MSDICPECQSEMKRTENLDGSEIILKCQDENCAYHREPIHVFGSPTQ